MSSPTVLGHEFPFPCTPPRFRCVHLRLAILRVTSKTLFSVFRNLHSWAYRNSSDLNLVVQISWCLRASMAEQTRQVLFLFFFLLRFAPDEIHFDAMRMRQWQTQSKINMTGLDGRWTRTAFAWKRKTLEVGRALKGFCCRIVTSATTYNFTRRFSAKLERSPCDQPRSTSQSRLAEILQSNPQSLAYPGMTFELTVNVSLMSHDLSGGSTRRNFLVRPSLSLYLCLCDSKNHPCSRSRS